MIRNFVLLLLLISSAYAKDNSYPHSSVFFSFPLGIKNTVYKGETLRTLIHMEYSNLLGEKRWTMPEGIRLEYVGGNCPSIPLDYVWFWGAHICDMNIAVYGDKIGAFHWAVLNYNEKGSQGSWPAESWNITYETPPFYVQVLPHPLEMLEIPYQKAVARVDFELNIKPFVRFFDEHVEASDKPKIVVQPQEQNGLRYDTNTQILSGIPESIGEAIFEISAVNKSGTTKIVKLQVSVSANSLEKPKFKTIQNIASAVASKKYLLNLVNLIENKNQFLQHDQVSFRIDRNQPAPKWLAISEDRIRLEGIVPNDTAGQNAYLYLIAHSNTGGDSDPELITIPIIKEPKEPYEPYEP